MAHQVDPFVHAVVAHVRRAIGPVAHVLHWDGPGIVHLDILHIPPNRRRRCHTLITCGMSRRPMCPPRELCECRFAELYLSMPEDWPFRIGSSEEEVLWPVRALAQTALLPHISESWLWYGHTIGFPDPEDRITPGTPFSGWIIGPHLGIGHAAGVFRHSGRRVEIFSLLPVFRDELAHARTEGSPSLFLWLEEAGVTEVVDIGRSPSVGAHDPGLDTPLRRRRAPGVWW